MKKKYLLILTVLLFVLKGFAQVSVTNPTNTAPNLAATYGSLAVAITALSGITAISGPVIITLNAGNPQTAPAGGYVIQFAATTTAANNITITGNNNIITAFTPQTTGNLNDGIFKLIGADYITLENFTMQENTANTTNTPSASNNMTEWGVALLRASATDGAQNNTIQNNIISLDKNYRNTFGIYSNARHVATSPTTSNDATAVTGSNFGNRIYGNNISNVMMGITFIGSAPAAFQDAGNDIGGTSVATGNTITNWGGDTPLSAYVSNSGTSYCIFLNHQVAENVSYNTITSGIVGTGVSTTFSGIRKEYTTTTPIGTFTSTISHNTITMTSDFIGGNFECIRSQGMALSTGTMNISNNNLLNNAITGVGSTSSFTGIICGSACGTLNVTNNIMRGLTTISASGFNGILQSGAVVNTINITNNKIGDAVAGAATQTTATTAALNGISNTGGASTATLNITNNSIDGFSVVNYGTINFIHNSAGTLAAVNMNNNLLGTTTGSLISFSDIQTNALNGFNNPSGNASMVVSIQNNDIRGIVNTVTGTGSQQYINCQAPVFSSNISNNTFTNLSINSSATLYLILRGGILASGTSAVISNNNIVGSFSKTASGGTVYGYNSGPNSVSGSTITISGNNFSNVTVTGATSFVAINDAEGVSVASAPTKIISGNTISNVTMGSGTFYGLQISKGESITSSSNSISNITGTGYIYGIYYSITNGAGTHTCALNTITSLVSTGAGGSVVGIWGGNAAMTTWNINNNSITALSSTGTAIIIAGVRVLGGNTINLNDNQVNNLSGAGGGGTATLGIGVYGGSTINLYNNNIHSLSIAALVPGVSTTVVNGIYFAAGTTCTAYNNFISDLTTPNLSATFAIAAIEIGPVAGPSTYDLYYNSIYVNAVSSGTNFGTYGVYAFSNATSTSGALNMINNIIVNTSTPNGAGVAAAYGRTTTTLTNYAATADNNLLYAGNPSTGKLIFYDGTNRDQTLAAYQTRVSTRDANSISLMPAFVSATDLHLTTANCRIDGRGIPVAGISDDIDLATRNATTPDIGADEFTATTSTVLAGAVGVPVCEDRIISVTGTTYTANTCDLIARVLPSGADPVAGKVNVCVTLDATQQFFNGEPYVQRHFDIEPTTGSASTTSATITLYFTDAEFALYNSTNLAWPALPTLLGGGNTDPNRANVKVTQFHGVASTSPSSPGNYPGVRVLITPTLANVFWNGMHWEITFDVAGFSGFYVHTNTFGAPLPITVNYLNGRKQGSNHVLDWKVTCVSTPKATMTLERSNDARNFTGMYSITADAARCNQPFDYTEANPLKGMNYYRLKIVDADGRVTYSTTVALLNAAKGFDIISIAPNPVVNGNFKLNVTNAVASKMDITIIDMQGRLLQQQNVTVIAGFNSLPINVANLATGTYSIQATIADEKSKVIRFVKQ